MLLCCFVSTTFCFKSIGETKEMAKVEIIKVYDGDTLHVQMHRGEIKKIGLIGIDCYETLKINRAYKQSYLNQISIEKVVQRGKESKKILQSYIKNCPNNFYVKVSGNDSYKRTLGTLYCREDNVNRYMLNQGKCMEVIYQGK